MKYTIQLHPEVIVELDDSYLWYEERMEGLGVKFIASVNKRLNEIAENPERYARKNKNYRETGIEVFPYVIIYEIMEEGHAVFISYIFHSKRNPSSKYKR